MLSVVFSTLNGASTLPRMLDAFTRLTEPRGGWRIICVDNGSTDDTAQVIEAFRDRLPLLLLHEPRRGKNVALNSAIGETQGDLIIFTDDDILPRPDWLARWRDCADSNGSFSVFGGAILPEWDQEPARWLLETVPVGPVFAYHDPVPSRGEIEPRMIWGPNMAVRREVFSTLTFNESVGPDGSASYRMGSEVDFNRRAAAAGYRCFFEPSAVVRHIIRAYQTDPRWVLKRAFRFGRSCVDSNAPEYRDVARMMGYPRYLLRRAFALRVRAGVLRLLGDEEHWFKATWALNTTRGMLTESRQRD